MAQELVTLCDGPGCDHRTADQPPFGWLDTTIVITEQQRDSNDKVIPKAGLVVTTRTLHFHDYTCLSKWAYDEAK
jgi:hypothetical protein